MCCKQTAVDFARGLEKMSCSYVHVFSTYAKFKPVLLNTVNSFMFKKRELICTWTSPATSSRRSKTQGTCEICQRFVRPEARWFSTDQPRSVDFFWIQHEAISHKSLAIFLFIFWQRHYIHKHVCTSSYFPSSNIYFLTPPKKRLEMGRSEGPIFCWRFLVDVHLTFPRCFPVSRHKCWLMKPCRCGEIPWRSSTSDFQMSFVCLAWSWLKKPLPFV